MPWNPTYVGTAETAAVTYAIECCSREIGMRPRRTEKHPGEVVIVATQTAPWYRVLLGSLPQRIQWIIHSSDSRVSIECISRFFWWYRGLLVGLIAAMVASFVEGWRFFEEDWSSPSEPALHGALRGLLLAFSVFLFFVNWGLVIGHHRPIERVLEAIRREADTHDGHLESLGISKRFQFVAIGYLAVIFGLMIWVFQRTPEFWTTSILHSVLTVGLLVLIGALALVLWITARRGGALLRLTPALAGIGTAVPALFVLVVPVVWLFPGLETVDEWPILAAKVRAFLEQKPDDVSLEEYIEKRDLAEPALAELRKVSLAMVCGMPVLMLVPFFLWTWAVRYSVFQHPYIRRLRVYAGKDRTRDAISGGDFLRLFRVAVIGVWVMIALLLSVGVALSTFILLDALFGFRPGGRSVVSASTAVAAVAFKAQGDEPIGTIVRGFWVMFGASTISLPVLSVWGFVKSQTATHRRLQTTRRLDGPLRADLERVLIGTSAGQRYSIEFVVTDDAIPYARSYCFGFFQRRHFIEVSVGCFELLGQKEWRAVLAHEASHVILGHCRRDTVFHFLGRISLVGGGIPRVLQDTFGYERTADDMAVAVLGADPRAMMTALWKLRNVQAALGAPVRTLVEGLGAVSSSTESVISALPNWSAKLSPWARWCIAWRLYLDQYRSSGDAVYWHPAIEERIQWLQELSSQTKERGSS